MTTHVLPRPAVARPPRIELTRRGRLLFVGLPLLTGAIALIAVAVVFLVPQAVQATTEPVDQPVTRTVTVQASDSLWDVAVAADPSRDTREVIDDIVELNDLASSVLVSGQQLEVPAP